MKNDEQIKKEMADIFNTESYTHFECEIRREEGSVFVKITTMYDQPEHNLSMVEFARRMVDAVGADEMEEYDSFDSAGCETCDYGSCYGTEFRFWKKS